MGPLSVLLLISACCIGAASLFLLFVVTLTVRQGRVGALLGLRSSLRRPVESLVRAVPTALVISVVLASLSVGDSLLHMVEEGTEDNLSGADASIISNGPVPTAFMDRLASLSGTAIRSWAPVVQRDAVGRSGQTRSSFDVKLLALDDRSLGIAPLLDRGGNGLNEAPGPSECYINEELSRESGASVGDWVLIEISRNDLSGRSLLGMSEGLVLRTNLTVRAVLREEGWGRYREDARAEAPPVLIADLSTISLRLGWSGMSDSFILDLGGDGSLERVKDNLDEAVDLVSAGLDLGDAGSAGGSMLWSKDVFFEAPPGLDAIGGNVPTLSYFVDSIVGGNGSVPYSVVTGMDDDLGPDGIAIGEWLGDRLNVTIGDDIELRYRRLTELGTLVEAKRNFTVREVVPQEGLAAEPSLMPPIPGITGAVTCSDWDPSFDIDLDLLDEEDRAYWDDLRTSPKAFVSLEAAREMWKVHYGDTTAVWFPEAPEDLRSELNEVVGGKDANLMVLDLREKALSSSRGLEIFPPMFLTFGVPFIVASIFVLVSLERDLFLRRLEELSVLKAVGASKRSVAASFVWGSVPSLVLGGIIGVAAGALMGLFFSAGLSTIWSDTVEDASVPFSLSWASVLISVLAGASISLLTSLLLSLVRSGEVPVKNLRGEEPSIASRGKKLIWAAVSGVLMAAGLSGLLYLIMDLGPLPPEALFIGSMAALSAGLASSIMLLVPVVRSSGQALLLSSELSRRPARYPLAGAIMALTLSLVLSMSAVSGILLDDEEGLSSGYGGGYDLVMELSVPFTGDLAPTVDAAVPGARAVPIFTVGSEGGTCTNMNAVYPPRLVGVGDGADDWTGFSLTERDGAYRSDKDAWGAVFGMVDGMVPILVDQNTLVWIYGKGIGDRFSLDTEDGADVELVVIGILSPSVLTGTFVMSRENLLTYFPSLAAVRMALIEVPGDAGDRAGDALESAFIGNLPTVRTTSSLARENLEGELSYLDLFRDLLLLGLFTATVSSFSFVHARMVSLSRELSVLRAVGFDRKRAFFHLCGVNLSVISASVLSALACALIGLPVLAGSLSANVRPDALIGPVLTAGAFLLFSAVISSLSAWLALRSFKGLVPRD